jgi:cytochrome c peroxidase
MVLKDFINSSFKKLKGLVLYFSLFIFFSFVSCKKNDNEKIDPIQKKFILNLPVYFGEYFIPSNNPLTEDGIQLGRMLFYEKLLSKDSSISCSSCHIQKFAFSDSSRFSKGVNGFTKRNSMALVNLVYNRTFFWDGRVSSLEEQALIPIQDHVEMNLSLDEAIRRLSSKTIYKQQFKKAFGSSDITAEKIAKALAQFQRTLISADSKYDRYLKGKAKLTLSEYNGMILFQTHPEPERSIRGGNCGDCHTMFRTDGLGFENNGLDEEYNDQGRYIITGNDHDKGKFRIPTLRNIAVTAPYMHDGRFKTLKEVLDHYNEHVKNHPNLSPLIAEASNTPNGKKLDLTEKEKNDIIAFLNTLTDTNFLNNPNFSNPFE